MNLHFHLGKNKVLKKRKKKSNNNNNVYVHRVWTRSYHHRLLSREKKMTLPPQCGDIEN